MGPRLLLRWTGGCTGPRPPRARRAAGCVAGGARARGDAVGGVGGDGRPGRGVGLGGAVCAGAGGAAPSVTRADGAAPPPPLRRGGEEKSYPRPFPPVPLSPRPRGTGRALGSAARCGRGAAMSGARASALRRELASETGAGTRGSLPAPWKGRGPAGGGSPVARSGRHRRSGLTDTCPPIPSPPSSEITSRGALEPSRRNSASAPSTHGTSGRRPGAPQHLPALPPPGGRGTARARRSAPATERPRAR